jgi:hypothetical protein
MTFDVPTFVALFMLVASFLSLRAGRRGRSWRSGYAIIFLAALHLASLYQVFGPTMGRFPSESWAAITAAGIAGIAADDDADAVGLLLVVLGIFQVLILAGMLNLRAAP